MSKKKKKQTPYEDRKEYMKAYYWANKKRINKQCREYHHANKEKNKARKDAYNKEYHEKTYESRKELLTAKRYGITLDEYKQMFIDCDSKCEICNSTESSDRTLSVDHNHITGQIRGLLCHNCNTGIGQLKADENLDIIKKAIEYLENNNEQINTKEQ